MTTIPTLGSLLYDPLEEVWLGFTRLAEFEAWAVPATTPTGESIETIITRLKELRQKLALTDDHSPRTAQEDFDNWDDEPISRNEVQQRVWNRWIRKLIVARRAEGLLCIKLYAPNEEPPQPIQDKSVRYLLDQQTAVLEAIRQALVRCCQSYELEASQAASARIASVTVHNEGLDDLAPFRFGISCDWESEHGISVVYHPRTGAEWATADSVDELIAAACPPPAPLPPPTPEEEMVLALFSGDAPRVAELKSQGVRAEPPDGSALYGPIHDRSVDLVRQLLQAGADPNRTDSYEGTPLQAAQRALAEARLTLPSRTAWWVKALVLIPKLINSRPLRREQRNAEAIIRMLKEAGAKESQQGA